MSDIDHIKWARIALFALVNHILKDDGGNRYITYAELARKIGYPLPHMYHVFSRNIGQTLYEMGHLFDGITIDNQQIPLIQSLVVNQSKKLPSDGLKEFNETYPKLSDKKKRDFCLIEYDKIYAFGEKWLKLLDVLKIDKELINVIQLTKSKWYNPFGSEGSPEHKRLRDYIANNSHVLNVDSLESGITEYPLKSGDKIDVVFESSNCIFGVEVKSKRSGDDDLERGLYQCIKYKSVLEAENTISKKHTQIDCVLVIEGCLTKKLKKIQKKLNIVVYESISPK